MELPGSISRARSSPLQSLHCQPGRWPDRAERQRRRPGMAVPDPCHTRDPSSPTTPSLPATTPRSTPSRP